MIRTFRLPGTGPFRSILAGLSLLVLSACGGGDSPSSQQSTVDADASASASVAAFTAFTEQQIANSSEAAEPHPVQGIIAPVSDATEPSAI